MAKETPHTPEPWAIIQDSEAPWWVYDSIGPENASCHGSIVYVLDGNGRYEENATRIVACVNACEGINPEAVPDLLEAAKDAEKVMGAHIYGKPDVGPDHPYTKLKNLRAAIAKAESK